MLEWIRRQDPSFDKELKDYLFTEKQKAHEQKPGDESLPPDRPDAWFG
jgi:hypothetical protein